MNKSKKRRLEKLEKKRKAEHERKWWSPRAVKLTRPVRYEEIFGDEARLSGDPLDRLTKEVKHES